MIRKFLPACVPLLLSSLVGCSSSPSSPGGGAGRAGTGAGSGGAHEQPDAALGGASGEGGDAGRAGGGTGPFTIGGTLTGLFGGGSVVVSNNQGDELTLTADGPFTFAKPLQSGQAYAVTVVSSPVPAVTCVASAATGTVGVENVESVAISCSLYASCGALHHAAPTLYSGFYPISIGDTPYSAYCDMATDGGGWTQVFDQDVTVANGYLKASSWAEGVNVQAPNSGQYSILAQLERLKGASPAFEFLLDWGAPNVGSVEWTQVENPIAKTAVPTTSNIVEYPTGQLDDTGCGSLGFRGLSLTAPTNSGNGVALLNGDASSTCYFWALGMSARWNAGIPTYLNPGNLTGTQRARLWMRTDAANISADTSFSPCPADGSPCAIMPLGDSITFGYSTPDAPSTGGYRIQLLRDAWAANQHITFVGESSSGPATLDNKPFPQANEGHPGYTIDDSPAVGRTGIEPLVPASLAKNEPNIVTLMIGTNDVDTNDDLANAPHRLGTLIDTITSVSPNALLVVAQMIPTQTDSENSHVQAYNAAIPALIESRVAKGRHIILVDMYSAFTKHAGYATDYLANNLHPNEEGFAVMGDTWYAAIARYLH